MKSDAVRVARDAVAEAPVLVVVAFLMDVDPDGEWSPRDDEQSLRERAGDLAAQGIGDVFDLGELLAMLAVRS